MHHFSDQNCLSKSQNKKPFRFGAAFAKDGEMTFFAFSGLRNQGHAQNVNFGAFLPVVNLKIIQEYPVQV